MKRVLFLILLYVAWLPVFLLQKPWFMIYNNSQLVDGSSLADYFFVMLHGLKLDCTVVGYLTILPWLLVLVSVWWPGEWLRKALRGYFWVIAGVVALIFTVDVALYPYWGFRLDGTLLFYLQSPKDAMASVPISLFLSQGIAFLIYFLLIACYLLITVLPHTPVGITHRIRSSFLVLLLGGLMFIPIRGGVTTSTANVGMVYFSDNQFLNHAAINPCFSLLYSLSKQEDFAKQFDFYPEEERAEVVSSLLPVHASTDSARCELLNTKRPNLLIILLESFSANTIEALGGTSGVTPNLNRLSKEGILFSNLYANSFRTDRGIVAVLNGYLAQPTTSIMKYPAKSQTLPSIARSLTQVGYTANMLYGGDINFTNMQSYFFSSGYSRITSDKDFPLVDRLSKWGANDDVTFRHLLTELKGRTVGQDRFLTTFLTLSSHEPFEVPYHRLSHPYLNSVAFTDSCLGRFIDELKLLPIWKDLLVVLVADHGFRYPDGLKEYEPRRFHIPMLWLGGAVKAPRVIDTYANQTDLAATLLGQMGLSVDEFRFSKDLLSPHAANYAFYTFPNGFGFLDAEGGYTVYDNESNRVLLQTDGDSTGRERNGKALLQTLYDDLGSR